jgi:hypothetical protein
MHLITAVIGIASPYGSFSFNVAPKQSLKYKLLLPLGERRCTSLVHPTNQYHSTSFWPQNPQCVLAECADMYSLNFHPTPLQHAKQRAIGSAHYIDTNGLRPERRAVLCSRASGLRGPHLGAPRESMKTRRARRASAVPFRTMLPWRKTQGDAFMLE